MNNIMFLETNVESKLVIIDTEDYEKIKAHNDRLKLDLQDTGNIRMWSALHYRSILLARLIMGCVSDDGYDIDHRDLNPLNNTKLNLRKATIAQNRANRPKLKGAFSSKYKGVYRRKDSGKWSARVTVNKKNYCGGVFDTEEEAAKVANALFLKYQGEFARLNII